MDGSQVLMMGFYFGSLIFIVMAFIGQAPSKYWENMKHVLASGSLFLVLTGLSATLMSRVIVQFKLNSISINWNWFDILSAVET
jgi:hypothetical protein